ncbi:MAG: molybdopterin-binding protein [Heliobacteriaceae bacterium]|nr:molybdopterin-binding protein [Heliobacteriaceae bacterium]MDD4588158.1 molybdopterin-binding protein [Heliobacteriaceae bacterium]
MAAKQDTVGIIGEKIFLDNRPREEALAEYLAIFREHGSLVSPVEMVPVAAAGRRILAAAVTAAIPSPHFAAAAMDGIAVRAAETFGASNAAPKRLRLGKETVVVDTGDLVPPEFDAVIMVEYLQVISPEEIEIRAPAVPGQHIRRIGEDIARGAEILPQGTFLRPWDTGALLAGGVWEVPVYRRPVVAILPTGTELVPPGEIPEPGKLLDFNSRILAGLVAEWGGEPRVFPITPDDEAVLEQQLMAGLAEADVVVVNAGSSAGREDFTAKLVAKLGQLLTHGVAIKPGKPVILGFVRNKPVLGLPGYPVSATLTARLFLRPLLEQITGRQIPERRIKARLARKLPSPLGVEEWARVALEKDPATTEEEAWIAQPIKRGAGVIMSLVKADGLLCIPRAVEGLAAGEMVEIICLRQ